MSQKESAKNLVNPVDTIAALAFACTLIGILLGVKWFSYIVLCLLFMGLFMKNASRHLAHWWMKFASLLGSINGKILLTVIFFAFLTPLAYLYRLLKGDMILLKRQPFSRTYWTERNHRFVPADFDKMF